MTLWEVYDDQENLSDHNEIEIEIRKEGEYKMRKEQGIKWRAPKRREEEEKRDKSFDRREKAKRCREANEGHHNDLRKVLIKKKTEEKYAVCIGGQKMW